MDERQEFWHGEKSPGGLAQNSRKGEDLLYVDGPLEGGLGESGFCKINRRSHSLGNFKKIKGRDSCWQNRLDRAENKHQDNRHYILAYRG